MYKNVILSSVSSFIHLSPPSNLRLVGSLMPPVRLSITRVFVTMPSQKTPSGMIANPPPILPLSFPLFSPELQKWDAGIRWWRRSTERCVSSGPLWRTAGSFSHNQGLMITEFFFWGGVGVAFRWERALKKSWIDGYYSNNTTFLGLESPSFVFLHAVTASWFH